MQSNVLADVWMPGGRNFALRTIPGQVLRFLGGHAMVTNHSDMPHVLRMPEARIEIRREWREWLPNWIAACTPPFAEKVQATYWVAGDLDGCDGIAAAEVPATVTLPSDYPPDIAMASPGRHPAGHQCKLCDNYRKGLMKKRLQQVAV